MPSKSKKKYKALILDVDGTTIPLKKDGMPSPRVTQAINAARKKVFVGLATSRPYFMLKHIISHLELSGPSIVNSGANIVDSSSGKILQEKVLSKKAIEEIIKIAEKVGVKIALTNYEKHISPTEYEKRGGKILVIWADSLEKNKADKFLEKVSHIPTTTTLTTPSWTKGNYVVLVTQSEATKQHGILEVAKILGISTHEIIGVGDGYNDFPLLMACGLKVAMGNAVAELKEIADYIAPTVDEDGVADVINKFVL